MGVAPYSEADGMLVRRFLTAARDEALKALVFWMDYSLIVLPSRAER